MAEIPDLTFKMGNKPSTPTTAKVSSDATPSTILRFPSSGGPPSPAVKLSQTVPIHILRVEDKSSSPHNQQQQQQLTDSHGRPMGVANPVPALVQPGTGSLGGNTSGNVNSSNTGGATTRKKTGSSFQITSVTDGSRLSNDGGDDSADDLDESHTDDLSSELGVDMSKTDYDYSSEDAFSSIKDDPAQLLNQYQPQQLHIQQQQQQQQQQQSSVSSPVSTAPRISVFTTTQSDSNSANATAVESTANNVSVTVVESPATVPMSVVQNPDIQWQNRFRVVKIESSEPFRRGRWLCMDFLDPPPPTSSHCEVGDKESTNVSGGGNGSGNSSGTNSFQHGDSLVIEHGVASGSQAIVTSSWSIEPSVQSGAVGGVIGTATAFTDKGPLISSVGVNCDHYPVSIILQTQQQGNLDFTNTALHMQGRTPQFPHQGYNLAASNPSNSEYIFTSNVPTITTAQEYQQQPPQQQSGNNSDYTHPLPTTSQPDLHNIVSSQVIGHHQVSTTNSAPPTDFGSGGISPAPQPQQPTLVYPTPAAPNTDYSQQQQQQQQQQQPQSATVQPISSQIVSASATVITSQQQQPSQCYIQQVAPSAGNVTTNVTVSVPDSNQPAESGTNVSVGAAANTTPVPASVNQQGTNTVSGGGAPPVAVSGGGSVVSPSQETADGSQQVVQQSGEEGEAESLKALAAFLGEGHKLPGRSVSPIDDGAVVTSAKYSSSGASTVAIDNKIEQAMDLVKSHLMFAVREEVDVLKEKITELMERINQLEFENTILKAAASPETLALLANSQTPNPPST